MPDMSVDPITLSVLQNGLMQVCNEMDLAFVRSAFSPVIAEALDRSDGIYHRDSGELIAIDCSRPVTGTFSRHRSFFVTNRIFSVAKGTTAQ